MKFHGKAKVSGDLDAFGAQYACIGSLAARAKGHAQETSIFMRRACRKKCDADPSLTEGGRTRGSQSPLVKGNDESR